ncbi:MAG: VTT domain-containing protein [Opitutaceae bacterium]|nr:VTT domain-containing protein [Opitutaceae bacterium]
MLLKLGALLLVAVVVAVLVLRGLDVKGLVTRLMAVIGEMGPVAFFAAMALLPAVGFPLMAFCLTAGPAFGAQMGLGGILLASAAAILINVLLTYWLARVALRPLMEKLVARLGYRIPVVEKADQLELTILVRITPGPPFFVQSYLLGLAEIPFRTYILPSFFIPLFNITGVIIFGDALAQGKGKWAALGIGLVVAGGLAVHMLRRHFAKRKAVPSP